MKVLVVGGGGREHALAWKIGRSPLVDKVYAAPGNAGIAQDATCVPIAPDDFASLADFAKKEGIDLTVVGPEDPLCKGIVDYFESEGLTIFGPSQKAAQLEGSKAFSKIFMKRYGIPTAEYEIFEDADKAKDYIKAKGAPIVVKADGLAAGKGALVCATLEEALAAVDRIMVERAFGDAGNSVVVEEFLTGEEASFIAITDGEHIYPLAGSQDHKPIFDGDKGPNTGGMGAYSPAPVITPGIHEKVMERVMKPVVEGMKDMGHPFKGVIYAGLMIKNDEPKVLEYNVRFGDPEAQPILLRMKSDLVPALLGSIDGSLKEVELEYLPQASVCVVMASGGYPGSYQKGYPISGLEEVGKMEKVVVFHAGTALKDGSIVTNGGRVLGVTALGYTIKDAIDRAYQAAGLISWNGVQYRRDIGAKALKRLS